MDNYKTVIIINMTNLRESFIAEVPEVTEAVVGGGPGTLASAEATLKTDMMTCDIMSESRLLILSEMVFTDP